LTATLLASCARQDAEPIGGVLRRGITATEVETLDPQYSLQVEAQSLLHDLYEGLVRIDRNGTVQPAVAESWTVREDGLLYTFRLRPDARWSDGSAIEADAFVFAFRRAVDPATASPHAEKLLFVRGAREIIGGDAPPESLGVVASDARTLEIALANPAPYFLAMLADSALAPLHAASVQRHGTQFTRPGNLVSNGAYLLDARVGYQHIELVTNPHYWDRASVTVQRVRYVPYEEDFAQFSAYRAGDIDLTDSVPSSNMQMARDQFAGELAVRPAKDTFFYAFNLRAGQLAAVPELRQALSMAVQRDIVTRQVTNAGEQPAYSFVPPTFADYGGPALPWSSEPPRELESAARELLRAASTETDRRPPLRVLHNSNDGIRRVTVAVTSMWREALGVETELINQEFGVFLQTLGDPSAWDVARLSWRGDYDDPYSFLEIFKSDSPNNFVGLADAVYDDLLARSLRAQSPAARFTLLREAEQRLLDAHAIAPIYFYVDEVLAKPWVDIGERTYLKPLPTSSLVVHRRDGA
jgi:oligopeptide transport system substrate-binding protein